MTYTAKMATAAAMLVAMAAPSFAATLTLQDTLGTFNGVTEGFFSQQEVEGRLIVTGDVIGSTAQVGFVDAGDGADLDALYVFGTVSNSTFNLNNGVNGTVAGFNDDGNSIINSTFSLNGDGTLTLAGTRSGGNFNTGTLIENALNLDLPVVDFDSYRDESAALAALATETLTFSDPNNRVFGGTPDAEGLAVVTVDIADLASGGFSFDMTGTETLVINVTGETGRFGLNALGNARSQAENVIWNFVDATEVDINTAVIGHIVAPNARLNGFNGSTEGSVIASFINLTGGELHQIDFEGDLNLELDTDLTPVPLPATLPLMLAGLLGFGAMRRLRS